MAKGDSRIFITLEGGLVVSVFSSNPDDCVTIIDHDAMDDGDEQEIKDHEELMAELNESLDDGSVVEVY